jgi:DNA polymerase-3 subunit epsilon
MRLESGAVVFLDFQTNGNGHLLEAAWAIGTTQKLTTAQSQLMVPVDCRLPPRVSALTTIDPVEVARHGRSSSVVARDFLADLNRSADIQALVIHYARFEEPLLKAWTPHLALPLICTYELTRRLLPALPSRGIHALAAYFGHPQREFRRASGHVQATQTIWRGLVAALQKDGVKDFETLYQLLASPAPKRAKHFEYRVNRLLRLSLPERPGVYRFKDCHGEVLYVGKATSLKDRVNSYFRGKKQSPGRKLKMLMEAWDLEVSVCNSPLEAALLESDLIKKHDPPYNVSLKANDRRIWFLSRDLQRFSPFQNDQFPIGPFPQQEIMRPLYALHSGWPHPPPEVFYDTVEAPLRAAGLEVFCDRHKVAGQPQLRALVALGIRLLKSAASQTETMESDNENPVKDPPVTPTAVADKYERLIQRAALAYLQARRMTALLFADLEYLNDGQRYELQIRGGQIGGTTITVPPRTTWPWQSLSLVDFDRMRVLSSELQRFNGKMKVVRS